MVPARWQVMRVVWCLEPLKRSSLAVQRLGWAGRAAVTCSPFFTLILGRGQRPSVSSWVLNHGLNEGHKCRKTLAFCLGSPTAL